MTICHATRCTVAMLTPHAQQALTRDFGRFSRDSQRTAKCGVQVQGAGLPDRVAPCLRVRRLRGHPLQ